MKHILLYILLTIVCLSTVAATNISVSPNDWVVDKANRGDILQQQFTLVNTGNTTETFSISGTDDIAPWAFVNPSLVELSSGSDSTISVALIIPSNAEYKTYSGKLHISSGNFSKDFDIIATVDKYSFAINQTLSISEKMTLDTYSVKITSILATVTAELYLNDNFVNTFEFSIGEEKEIGSDMAMKLTDRYSGMATFTIYSINQVTPTITQSQSINTDCELVAWTSSYNKVVVESADPLKDYVQFKNTCEDKEITIKRVSFQNTVYTEFGERPIYLDGSNPTIIESKDAVNIHFVIDPSEVNTGVHTPILQLDYELDDEQFKTETFFTISIARTAHAVEEDKLGQTLSCPDNNILVDEKFTIIYRDLEADQRISMEEPTPNEGVSNERVYYDGDNWIWEGKITQVGDYKMAFILRENGGYVNTSNCMFSVVSEITEEIISKKNITLDHVLPQFNEGKIRFIAMLPGEVEATFVTYTIKEMTTGPTPSLIAVHNLQEVETEANHQYCGIANVPGYNTIKKCISIGLSKMSVGITPKEIWLGDTVTFTFKDSEGYLVKDITIKVDSETYTDNPLTFKMGTPVAYNMVASAPSYEAWKSSITPKQETLDVILDPESIEEKALKLVYMVKNITSGEAVKFGFNKITGWSLKLDNKVVKAGFGDSGSINISQPGNYSLISNGEVYGNSIVMEQRSSSWSSWFFNLILIGCLGAFIVFLISKAGNKKKGKVVHANIQSSPLSDDMGSGVFHQ